MRKVIAITGGIGSGKSIVSMILRAMGYKVYDSDSEARDLMNRSTYIKESIQKTFGNDIVINGLIDRKKLSDIVFSDSSKLDGLNKIVHGAVINDFVLWMKNSNNKVVFIETAVLYESGLDKYVSDIWEVKAPEDIRIERVIKRNCMPVAEVKKRIESQNRHFTDINTHNHKIINNDDETALLPQVNCLLYGI